MTRGTMREMHRIGRSLLSLVLCLSPRMISSFMPAQTAGSSSISGTVIDTSGAVVPDATVTVRNPVSGFTRTTTTDTAGEFRIANVPFNPYHVTVSAPGFAEHAEDVE